MNKIYSVEYVNQYIENMFVQDYMMKRIHVRGEVTNCTYHNSGHIYFSLKDESGVISCIMYARDKSGLSFRLSNGQKVIVGGQITVFKKGGKYNLTAKTIEDEGQGELYKKYLMLKQKLEDMGVFDPIYKQAIPRFVQTIGVVTAQTGDIISDIINTAKSRNPYVQIILYPSLVQGEGAAESIVRGIKYMDEVVHPDVLIIGRGGGSLEELWAFNEEVLAHAVFHCTIPIISAVGHSKNRPIVDYIADERAITPTEAGTKATYVYADYAYMMEEQQAKLRRSMERRIQLTRKEVERYETQMKYLHPSIKLENNRKNLNRLEEKLKQQMNNKVEARKHQLAIAIAKMQGLSPLAKLSQGYSYVSLEDGKNVRSITDVQSDDEVMIAVTDGQIKAKVLETKQEAHYGKDR